ncbi:MULTISPECIES: hypothetical protein [Thermus]|nr:MULTISPECIES: hypothetical protein [Thermus]
MRSFASGPFFLAALLPPWLAPWPLALSGLLPVPLFAFLGDALGPSAG